VFADGRASGVEVRRNGAVETITADKVVVSAGALHTPWLLMLSGIGPANHLRQHGSRATRPAGVGGNLMDHPAIHISATFRGVAPQKWFCAETTPICAGPPASPTSPRGHGDDGGLAAPPGMPLCAHRHVVVLYPAALSTGEVRLTSTRSRRRAVRELHWLSDQRDLDRMVDAFRRMANILTSDPVANYLSICSPPSSPSGSATAARRISRNAVLTNIAALV